MKNEKAFTLIELLTVVIILGILLALALPSIQSYLTRGTKEYYHSLEETVKESGKDYLNDYRALLPREIGNVTVIELKELTSNNYIKNVVDSNNKTCDARVTAKKIGKNEYEYYSCLDCGNNYQTAGEACYFDENENVTTDTKNYEIKVDHNNSNYEIDVNGAYIIDQGEDFTLPEAQAYYKGQLTSGKVIPKPRVIDTNKLGTTKVTYAYQGATTDITVKVVDRVAPSSPQIVLRQENSTGNIYTGGWYSGNIYQEYLSTDYSKPGIIGSGIKEYQISNDNKTFNTLTRNNQTTLENGSHTYYVRSIDKSGNVGNSNTYTIKIDKEVPTCSLKVASGTLGSNGWYTTDITIDFANITENVSSIAYKYISNTAITSNTTGATIYGMVKDQAGNVGTCSISVKVDKNYPSITAKNNGTTYINVGTSGNSINYFNYSYSNVSGNGNYLCTTNNLSNLSTGINNVTCTLTGVNGLQKNATMLFRHQYTATATCSSGSVTNNNTCSFTSNQSVCGLESYSCNPHDCNCRTYSCNCKNRTERYVCGTSPYKCNCHREKYCTEGSCSGYGQCVNGCWNDNYDYETVCSTCHRNNYCNRTVTECETCESCDTCYDTCHRAASCTKTSYLNYTCPTRGVNTTSGNTTINATPVGASCNGAVCTSVATCRF